MILLHNDYLLIRTSNGETIPCSAETVTIELVGDAVRLLDPEVVRQVAAAVLHYFKHDLGRETVSIADFSVALQRVLTAFGFKVDAGETAPETEPDACDLQELAHHAGEAFELAFFNGLRSHLKDRLTNSPGLMRFRGLRNCVKQLLGAKRWSCRCQALNDQIVDFLRECLKSEGRDLECALMVT